MARNIGLRRGVVFGMGLLFTTVLGCSPGKPLDILVGHWETDNSERAIQARTEKMQKVLPTANPSDLLAKVRAMGGMSLDLASDKSFELRYGPKTYKGTWVYLEEAKELELNFAKEPAAPQAETAPDAPKTPFKPTFWIGAFDISKRELDFYPVDRATYNRMKLAFAATGKQAGAFQLKKK